jgi:predicted phosphodiesterase
MLGLLANSDGRSEIVQAAVSVFLSEGVDLVLHCGDIGGRHVLDEMAPVGGAFVWGDRDHDRTGLMRHGLGLGLVCFGLLGDFAHAEKKLAIVHGHEKSILKKLISEQQYDYILCGHEAKTEDQTVGKTRILNPGPLYGPTRSAMVLDPFEGKVKIVAL